MKIEIKTNDNTLSIAQPYFADATIFSQKTTDFPKQAFFNSREKNYYRFCLRFYVFQINISKFYNTHRFYSLWHNRFSENENEALEANIIRHQDSKTKKPRHRDSKVKKPRHRETETINPRHRNSKTFFQRTKSHDIEIPRLKNHDIEIPRPKSCDIEFLWNSDLYTP